MVSPETAALSVLPASVMAVVLVLSSSTTGKRTSAVLLSAEDWQAIQETLHLLSIPGMRESIKEGMAEPLDESARELDW